MIKGRSQKKRDRRGSACIYVCGRMGKERERVCVCVWNVKGLCCLT